MPSLLLLLLLLLLSSLRDELAEKKLASENRLASLENEVATIEKMKDAAENDALNAAEKITSLGMIITIFTNTLHYYHLTIF